MHFFEVIFRDLNFSEMFKYFFTSECITGDSCSSRWLKDCSFKSDKRNSTSLSESLDPSMRVEEPMLSIVATFFRANKRSGVKTLKFCQAPLNSSISEIKLSISEEIVIFSTSITADTHIYIHKYPNRFSFDIFLKLYPWFNPLE
jgi:hypothetical protein